MTNATTSTPVIVWIDAERATVVDWHAGEARLRRFESEVPPHRRTTGHLRHEPLVRHGGGGPRDGEAHRLEHVRRFLAEVAAAIAEAEEVRIVGPGTIGRRLQTLIEEHDREAGRQRPIGCEAEGRLTDRQLVARMREVVGEPPRRQRPRLG
jgi:hypothetical protein